MGFVETSMAETHELTGEAGLKRRGEEPIVCLKRIVSLNAQDSPAP